MGAFRWVSVRVEADLAKQVDALARRQQRSRSGLVRWLLEQALAAEEQGHVNVSRAQAAYKMKQQSQEGHEC